MTARVGNRASKLSDVASLLWAEREILERLLFKLIEEQLVAGSGHVRWLAAANREVESALLDLRGTEVVRAAEIGALTDALGLPPGATLAELADAAPEPWSDILREHRDALRTLTAEIDEATDDSRRILDAGARSVRETLLSLSASGATYDARGVTAAHVEWAARVDQQA